MDFLEYSDISAEVKGAMVRIFSLYMTFYQYLNIQMRLMFADMNT
jgi:hypothetical protein